MISFCPSFPSDDDSCLEIEPDFAKFSFDFLRIRKTTIPTTRRTAANKPHIIPIKLAVEMYSPLCVSLW